MTRPIYNPEVESKDELISNFVVRLNEFKSLMDDIHSSKMEHPEQHYLIQGLRGMGKTTLLLRIKYQIEKDPSLNQWLIPVFLSEETYNISSLSNLWERIAEYLDNINIGNEKLLVQFIAFEGNSNYRDLCFNAMTDFLRRHNKKMLLLFDNIGEFFFQKLKEKDTHRLREILLTSPYIRIIGASSMVLEYTYDYNKPFYDFFHTIHLDGLNKEETMLLLEKMQERLPVDQQVDLKKREGQIETLRLLTGGVIRTIIILDEILVQDKDGTAINKLNEILDRITPLYKHRMDNLKPQQQKIMDAIAKNWDAISAGDLSELIKEDGVKQSSKHISAQLAQLEKNDLIIKKETNTKNHLYQIKERFFNIWYLMRNGSQYDKRRVIWLTKFLEAFYGSEGIELFIEKHLQKIKCEGYDKYSAYMMAEAISHNKYIDYEQQDKLLKETRNILPEKLQNELSHSAKEELEKVDRLLNSKEYDKGLSVLFAIQPKSNHVYFLIGLAYTSLRKFDEAIKYYLLAVELGNITALHNLGYIYHNEIKDFNAAEMYYLMAIEKGVFDSMPNLAFLYEEEFKDYEKAEKYYLMAIEKGEVAAMNNLACLYRLHFYDINKVEKYLKMAIEKDNAEAMNNLAALYFEQNRNKTEALKLSSQAFEKSRNINDYLNFIRIALWNNNVDEVTSSFKELLLDRKILDNSKSKISNLLQLFLAKKQGYFVLDLFNSNPHNLKDRYKPIYYALMSKMKKEFPNEYFKMGAELKKPVSDVLKNIDFMANHYE